jgi:hypothetical protein
LLLGIATGFPGFGCSESDPVVTVIRLFDPLGQVVVRLEAVEVGGVPDLLTVEWLDVPRTVVREFVYAVWLRPRLGGEPFLVARYELPEDSTFELGVQGSELINLLSEVLVTLEPESQEPVATTPSEELLTHRATAGSNTLDAIDALLGYETHSGPGFVIRLSTQARALRNHAGLARSRADAGNVDEARQSLEHLLNVADVPPLDHDGNSLIENPDADEFGLRSLADSVVASAEAAGSSGDPWPDAIQHSAQVALAADTMGSRLERLIDLAQDGLAAQDLPGLRSFARAASALSATLVGNPDAAVAGPCGQCGALTAWQQSLLMTVLRAQPQDVFVLP